MAEIIRMPLMSDTMTEGVLVEWHKKIGDEIQAGDVLAEIETDKATMELESFQEGTLIYIGVDAGGTVPVNQIIAILGTKGEDVSAILAGEGDSNGKAEPAVAEPEPVVETPVQTPTAPPPPVAQVAPPAVQAHGGRIKASPLAKKMAAESGIDISMLKGSGEDGRIVKKDIEQAIAGGGQAQQSAPQKTQKAAAPSVGMALGQESYEDVPNSSIRKTIARRLSESKFQAPHFYLKMEIVMDNAIKVRKQLNELSPSKISFNDLVVKAAAVALKQHPDVNASWMGDFIRFNHHVHIGVAVATETGLMVPVVKNADMKGLSTISAEVRDKAGRAREKKLGLDEMQGDTFTISNLGMMDIDDFTAIINPPASCIMAVGRIAKVPRFDENNEIVPSNVMRVTLSCDHRVVDGAVAAAFLQTFKAFLEEPVRLMI